MSEPCTQTTRERVTEWQDINVVLPPRDRYILLCDKNTPIWDGNMEVGRWFGDDHSWACFWSCGGPNGGLEISGPNRGGHYEDFTHWRDLPEPPP